MPAVSSKAPTTAGAYRAKTLGGGARAAQTGGRGQTPVWMVRRPPTVNATAISVRATWIFKDKPWASFARSAAIDSLVIVFATACRALSAASFTDLRWWWCGSKLNKSWSSSSPGKRCSGLKISRVAWPMRNRSMSSAVAWSKMEVALRATKTPQANPGANLDGSGTFITAAAHAAPMDADVARFAQSVWGVLARSKKSTLTTAFTANRR
mmetsp:Transcript_24291/g.68270  ORF Transcript_24291/g.68270 Transcript_24291/m.68270 type:complete len:210 (+) Transcript_24291:611-1240(+)